ncbi:c-type cytochrome [Ramlibacter tataouinensis]|uniref:c-type cytochrome n=1 Tax=Ramlibacter tataouinensis TaxID=94132 RepID=UPI0022F3CC60|nr:c-type cytochrome [Ramlibacter tataouinensis]WBY01171.1 c-type cytochrome [Ramlibacter tataouinensis]
MRLRHPRRRLSRVLNPLMLGLSGLFLAGCGGSDPATPTLDPQLVAQGKQIFREDTFGDEAQWTDTLRMHEVIEQNVTPKIALDVGLKVDSEALPAAVVEGIQKGTVDLNDTKTTLALIQLGAVVGVKGTVETVGGVERLTKVGITCALCHSTVDNSFAKGIGKRLDGWPNRDLDPGLIISLSPALTAAQKAVYASWGKGKFDPRFNVDGKSKPVVIPPAFGLLGVNKVTYTGDGDEIAYWNRYVSVVEMGGQGSFSEPRLNLDVVHGTQDMVSAKLPALQAYQLSLAAPAAPAGSFNAAAAERGRALFFGAGQCATCHSGATFTDSRLHPPSASMAEPESPSYASRSATGMYRATPLRGNWQHPPYFHDGSAADQEAVVDTYNRRLNLGLSAQEVQDLAQYLRSL